MFGHKREQCSVKMANMQVKLTPNTKTADIMLIFLR